jgi:DNA (cytosine-5)-methyltransferase 1
MMPTRPASTITTASGHIGSDYTIHPWENRVLSELECAELQTIPRSFDWGQARETHGSTFIRDMIGEAVPPHFTERHGRVLRKLLIGNLDRSFMSCDDPRHVRAMSRLKVGENDGGDEG